MYAIDIIIHLADMIMLCWEVMGGKTVEDQANNLREDGFDSLIQGYSFVELAGARKCKGCWRDTEEACQAVSQIALQQWLHPTFS